jgi:hypothetical protein
MSLEHQATAAVALAASHPGAPAADALEIVFRGSTGRHLDRGAPWIAPASPFGRLVAAAFDCGMTPEEWRRWSGPPADPQLTRAVLVVWRDEVLERFARRFGLVG